MKKIIALLSLLFIVKICYAEKIEFVLNCEEYKNKNFKEISFGKIISFGDKGIWVGTNSNGSSVNNSKNLVKVSTSKGDILFESDDGLWIYKIDRESLDLTMGMKKIDRTWWYECVKSKNPQENYNTVKELLMKKERQDEILEEQKFKRNKI